MSRHRIRYTLEYLLYRQLTFAATILPRRFALGFGALVGGFFGLVFAKRSKLSERNMQLAIPEMSPEQVSSEVKGMFRHLGLLAMDILSFKRFHDEPDLNRYFDFENLEHLQQAHAGGKGVLILTAHLGNWEGGSCFLPRLGFPTCFIAKKLKNPQMDAFIKANREQGGAEMIDAKLGARRILKSLNEGKVICVLLDQHHRDGVLVDFFGRPAYTTPVMVQLAMKTGAPVVPAFTLRTEDNRYTTSFGEPIQFAPSSSPETLKQYTQQCNDLIEAAVRKKPSQWFWLHNRWRHNPAVNAPHCADLRKASSSEVEAVETAGT